MYDPKNHSSLLWIDLVPALVPLGSARWQKRKISAHYRELIWFLIWFHLVPHVGRSPKSQFTIRNWFGSWFGSTWFQSCEKECWEEPLPTMYWGSVGLMDRLHKKCLSISHQHREPNVNWISSLSDSDRLEIQLTFGFRCWWLSLSAQPAFASQKLQCEVFPLTSLKPSQQIWSTTCPSLNQTGVKRSFGFVGLA